MLWSVPPSSGGASVSRVFARNPLGNMGLKTDRNNGRWGLPWPRSICIVAIDFPMPQKTLSLEARLVRTHSAEASRKFRPTTCWSTHSKPGRTLIYIEIRNRQAPLLTSDSCFLTLFFHWGRRFSGGGINTLIIVDRARLCHEKICSLGLVVLVRVTKAPCWGRRWVRPVALGCGIIAKPRRQARAGT